MYQRRVTPEVREDFEKRARRAGFKNGNEMIDALIYGKIRIENGQRAELARFLGNLGKMGSNLNQIAYKANSGQIRSLTDERKNLIEIREGLEELATEVRRALGR